MARLWAEVWTRPGDVLYERKIADLPVESLGGTQGYSGVYSGNAAVPKNYPRLGEILYTDAVTPANGVWSTVKVFSDSQTDPIFEFLPDYLVPAQSKSDTTVKVSGNSIDGIMGFARVEPWDWDGTADFVSTFPDWIYGGRNMLGNPGFETSTCRPEVNQIELVLDTPPTPMSGSFFLNDGVDSTASIDTVGLTAFILETALETNPAWIDDVVVTGAGTEDDPFVIEFVDPCVFPGGLFVVEDPGDPWVDGVVDLVRTQFGALQPNPWTKSQVVSSGTPRIFGEYTSFRVTTAQAHTGIYSLLIDPATIGRRFAGAQQILRVEPGGTYQASVWVYTASAGQEYRLVIRGIDEDLLETATGNAMVQVTPAANTWTQLALTDVLTGDNEQIILRIANINVSGNPAIFYVDDGSFTPGLPPATVGLMMEELYADATADHPPRVVWEDESIPGSPYLALDFDASLDSDGAAWDRSDVSLTFRPRMTYVQVLEEFVREGGYEWRVVAGGGPNPLIDTPGYYLLQIFNPATLGSTMPAGIQGGSADISHNARYFAPNASNVVMQGSAQLSARATEAGLLSAFGRIEGSQLDLNVTSLTSAASGAAEAAASGVRGAEALVYTLRGVATEPLVRYRAGDTINIEDPPIVSGTRRVSTIEFSIDSTGVEYTVSLGSEALLGQAAVNHQVGVLLKRFQRADEPVQAQGTQIFGGGGMMTVAVAASNSSSSSQSKADFVCDGIDDHVEIMAAMEICYAATGGTVWLSEGNFSIDPDTVIVGFNATTPEPIIMRGLGQSTVIEGGSPVDWVVLVADFCELRDMRFSNVGGS